jgi:hypothetical protein
MPIPQTQLVAVTAQQRRRHLWRSVFQLEDGWKGEGHKQQYLLLDAQASPPESSKVSSEPGIQPASDNTNVSQL